MRLLKLAALSLLAPVIIAIGSVFLFWLGRTSTAQQRGELVVDPELDSDDPGEDVDR